jgi:hypothetical protein
MAGVRLQQCVARTFEAERLAAFRRLCGQGCDRARISETFERTAREFAERNFTLANLFGASTSDKLGREWHEEEATGAGTWTRRESTGVFDAAWKQPDGAEVAATIEIARAANRIAIVRIQKEGRCVYQGSIAADEKSVRGTYACSWASGAFAWSATIGD